MTTSERIDLDSYSNFVVICAAVLVAIMAGLVLLVLFADLGLSTGGSIALVIGGSMTALLTMVLMGLVFFSDRSGRDDP